MKSKYYKLKHTPTGRYWDGYSSKFSATGMKFSSIQILGDQLHRQSNTFKLSHDFNQLWANECSVEEITIVETSSSTNFDLDRISKSSKYMTDLIKLHTRSFYEHYTKMLIKEKGKVKYNYCVVLDYEYPYDEFLESIKNLGYNSRSYKKTYRYLWVEDDTLMSCIVLLGHYSKTIKLQELHEPTYQAIKDLNLDPSGESNGS